MRTWKVISVSLGSSRGNKTAEVEILGRPFELIRVGTDGSLKQAAELIATYDEMPDVKAIGLGGIDRYIILPNGRRYEFKDAAALADRASLTPVVDGSGLKHTLERRVVQQIARDKTVQLLGCPTFLVCGVDRFGMAEALHQAGAKVTYGDLLSIGLPWPLRSATALELLGQLTLPIITRLPFAWVYPTGEKQSGEQPVHRAGARLCAENELIAGDFHYVRKYMSEHLDGKVILTNTTRPHHVEELQQRGLSTLITTTPAFAGGSFGTNVMEGVLVALLEKPFEEIDPHKDYPPLLDKLGWGPNVVQLN